MFKLNNNHLNSIAGGSVEFPVNENNIEHLFSTFGDVASKSPAIEIIIFKPADSTLTLVFANDLP